MKHANAGAGTAGPVPARTFPLGPLRLSASDIIDFARIWDPQPMHLDPAAAARSPLGGLAASGWHSSGLGLRMLLDSGFREYGYLGCPSVESHGWPTALLADETLVGTARVLSTASDPLLPAANRSRVEITLTVPERDKTAVRGIWSIRTGEPDAAPGKGVTAHQAAAAPTRPLTAQMLYLGGLEPGATITLGRLVAEETDIRRFLELSEGAAPGQRGKSLTPATARPNPWLACAFWMRCLIQARQAVFADLSEAERRLLAHSAAVGLGFEGLECPLAIRPGERVHGRMTLLDARESRSLRNWGIARWRVALVDDDSRVRLSFEPSLLMRKP